MKRVYLVQRLKKPRGIINPFSFGGGIINGGFNPDAMKIIKDIMSFDYMGAAEFEWGAVPTALKALITCNPIKIEIKSAISNKWIGIICPKEIDADVIKWVADASNETPILKERLCLKETLEGKPYNDFAGWLKIEDDDRCKESFMFFVDKEMYENVCKLIGI